MLDKSKAALAFLLLLGFILSANGCCLIRKVSDSVKTVDSWVKKYAW